MSGEYGPAQAGDQSMPELEPVVVHEWKSGGALCNTYRVYEIDGIYEVRCFNSDYLDEESTVNQYSVAKKLASLAIRVKELEAVYECGCGEVERLEAEHDRLWGLADEALTYINDKDECRRFLLEALRGDGHVRGAKK